MTDKIFDPNSQEKKIIKIVIFTSLFLLLLINSVFTLDQRQQALVLQFGEPVRLITRPGLKFKKPFVQNVIFFDKRLLDLGIQEQEVIALDQKRLIINAYTKYKIIDPLKFYTTVRNEFGLKSRLGSIFDSSLRQVIGEVKLSELLTENRNIVMTRIKEIITKEAKIFGIEIVDVRIMRGDLPQENSQAIFARMQTDREKEAREIRANGAEEAQKIKAEADKEKTIILATAKKQSEILKGEGDSLAIKIYASSYNRDPEFADFYRSMSAYKKAFVTDKTKMIISPDSEFFKYFGNI